MPRPLPNPTADSRPFWDGCAAGELRYQRCARCGQTQLIPRALCAACQHDQLQWQTSRGLGRILSFTVVHRAPTPAFKEEVPYVIAIVDMEEGFRLMVNVKDGAGKALSIGQPVCIGYRAVDGSTLPQAEVVE
ncbi:Zn-ribbon domain-containing OB-fold protein [Variovorax ginsengisoli]|uniref:OB-fold domain-containing protein n=1 Tax=Variovorax ginsengisoli TaxID=363844 RepID=A0ABT8SFX7_9BURK|nr:OB-fold domain-containing protein [Variovorax ginsengisoli]MDN8618475.1 OB-fold domain-containing protein [Variovorax ginsengisoli]MDO1537645.1 OB-fold domain-containing protein [Variovorax ginsengisoli]